MSELMHRLAGAMPFVPPEARLRLRQQRIDAEAARTAPRLLGLEGVEVSLLDSRAGRGSWREVVLAPIPTYPRPATWGTLAWDGSRLRAVLGNGRVCGWQIQAGGVKPEFAAEEVARVGRRPVTSGECPTRVVEFAAVELRTRGTTPGRLFLLDEESRQLGAFPAHGLTQEGLARLADAAGVVLRTYAIKTGGRVWPDELCSDALFPRSARRQVFVNGMRDDHIWRY
ncbi:MAG TPA: hypothetical protein VFU73_02425 [Actinocrinis sp.]|nr:hypothetical protein [Actinocrinis sp.]